MPQDNLEPANVSSYLLDTTLVIAYHVLKEQKPYHDLGVDYFFKQNKEAVQRRCIRQLERLGLQVTVKLAEEAHPNN